LSAQLPTLLSFSRFHGSARTAESKHSAGLKGLIEYGAEYGAREQARENNKRAAQRRLSREV